MLLFTALFLVAAIAVLCVKRSVRPPYGSPEYKWDERVVASILALLALGFAAMAWLV